MNMRDKKKHLRESIAERIVQMDEKSRAAESRSLSKRILECISKDIRTIAGYVPLKSEADILPVLQQLLERGCQVYLPVFQQDSDPLPLPAGRSLGEGRTLPRRGKGHLTFRAIQSFDKLKPGPLNILEPPEFAPEFDPQSLDIALIPARAFDRQGWRLGRGNGGYDKWIRKQRELNPKTRFWGIALECQIVNEVPKEEHDERVDKVITARGVLNIEI